MFRQPAWAVSSYSRGPPAARTIRTKSTEGFYCSDVPPWPCKPTHIVEAHLRHISSDEGMGRRRQHQAGWPMPVSEWAPEAETRGGGAAATAAGVMNAVQLRKEGRWALGMPARSSPGWFSRLSLLFSGVRRTTHQTPKGRRREIEGDLEVRFAARFSTPRKNMA